MLYVFLLAITYKNIEGHLIGNKLNCINSYTCTHNGILACGKLDSNADKRWFLDECDLNEFNCDYETNYRKIPDEDCTRVTLPSISNSDLIYHTLSEDNAFLSHGNQPFLCTRKKLPNPMTSPMITETTTTPSRTTTPTITTTPTATTTPTTTIIPTTTITTPPSTTNTPTTTTSTTTTTTPMTTTMTTTTTTPTTSTTPTTTTPTTTTTTTAAPTTTTTTSTTPVYIEILEDTDESQATTKKRRKHRRKPNRRDEHFAGSDLCDCWQ